MTLDIARLCAGDHLIEVSIDDVAALGAVFDRYRFDAVMHFAACSLVAESVKDPFKYYQNNVAATLALLQVMRDKGWSDLCPRRRPRCSVSLGKN